MKLRTAVFLASGLATSASALPAQAGEQTLEFTLVTHLIDFKDLKAPNVEGRSLFSANAFGVAFFKDGRVATKDFVSEGEFANGESHERGLSTYSFTDGSTLSLSYAGEFKDGRYHGDYTVLSGTGIYANATGDGVFDNQPTKWKSSAFLFSVKLNVKTP